MLRQVKYAVLFLLVLTVITGVIYPLVVMGFAQLFFRNKADGSIMSQGGKLVGSALIGQPFSDPSIFGVGYRQRARSRTTRTRLPAPIWAPPIHRYAMPHRRV